MDKIREKKHITLCATRNRTIHDVISDDWVQYIFKPIVAALIIEDNIQNI